MQLGLFQSAVLLFFGSLSLVVEAAQQPNCHVRRFPLSDCSRYDNRKKPNLRCWTQANTMESLINCVSSRVSNTWCPYFTHNEGGRLVNELDRQPGSCLSARMVLERGFRDPTCPMHVVGTMKSCKNDVPSYRGCMCDTIRPWRLEKLSRCFGLPAPPINCQRRLAKRSSPVVRREVDLRSPLLKDYDEYEDQDVYFYIDDYGRPIFTNAAGINLPGQDISSVYPLPSYDQLYPLGNRQAVRRCYFFPYTNHVWCTQWLLGEDDDYEALYPDATGLPQGASVKSSTGVTTSFAHTLTRAPGNTTPSPAAASLTPSHTMTGTPVDAVEQTGTETSTPTETGTSNSGEKKSAASSAVAPLLAALGVLALVI